MRSCSMGTVYVVAADFEDNGNEPTKQNMAITRIFTRQDDGNADNPPV